MWIILKMPFDSPILWCNYKVEVARRLITEGVSVRQVWIKTRCSTQKVTQWIKVNLQICSCQYVRIILSQTYNVSQLQCTSLVKKCYQKILYILSLASGRLENGKICRSWQIHCHLMFWYIIWWILSYQLWLAVKPVDAKITSLFIFSLCKDHTSNSFNL